MRNVLSWFKKKNVNITEDGVMYSYLMYYKNQHVLCYSCLKVLITLRKVRGNLAWRLDYSDFRLRTKNWSGKGTLQFLKQPLEAVSTRETLPRNLLSQTI